MQIRQIGGAVIALSGAFLAREFIIWAYGKVLDAASTRFGGVTMATFPWLDAAGLIALLVGLWLVFFKRAPKKEALAAAVGSPEAGPPRSLDAVEPDGEYTGDHEQLMLFVIDHLLPTIDAQRLVQDRLIREAVKPPFYELAVSGLRSTHNPVLETALGVLGSLRDSPPAYVPMDQMVQAVWDVESKYIRFVAKAGPMLAAVRETIWTSSVFRQEVDAWKERHARLLEAYEPLRRNSKLGLLFRPGRPSLFGRTDPDENLFIHPN